MHGLRSVEGSLFNSRQFLSGLPAMILLKYTINRNDREHKGRFETAEKVVKKSSSMGKINHEAKKSERAYFFHVKC